MTGDSALPLIEVIHASLTEVACDVLVVNLFAGVQHPGGATGAVDRALDGLLSEAIASGELTGKQFETRIFPTYGRLPARRVLVVGLGRPEEFDLVRAYRVAAAAARAARASGAKVVASIVHGAGIGGLDPAEAARLLVEGTLHGVYQFQRYRQAREPQRHLERFLIVERDATKVDVFRRVVPPARIRAEAVNYARDLGNEPPNVLTPAALADAARRLADRFGLDAQVWAGEELVAAGFHAVHAVGQGSQNAPQFIRLDYRGRSGTDIDLAIVGKGVTFDAGGLSLKPAANMEEMKFDMAGAAATLGTALAIAQLRPQVNVSFLIPAVENLPGGHSLRPGDIIQTYAGKTVEILNTDAEGRLILADAVAFARRTGAKRIVDIATLTGAAVIALGHHASALISNDEELAQGVERAAERAAERVWRLPSWSEYKEQFESRIADLKNVGGRPAGTITGGLIVGAFAETTPWAHLDIAGTAWLTKPKPYAEVGATGVGTRTLIQLCLDLAS